MQPAAVRDEQLFINGKWGPAIGHGTFQKKNPYTGEIVSRVAAAKREDARRAIDAAHAHSQRGAQALRPCAAACF